MTKPQSYPFMAIAKRYGLDYGDVLTVADEWRKGLDPYGRTTRVVRRCTTACFGQVMLVKTSKGPM